LAEGHIHPLSSQSNPVRRLFPPRTGHTPPPNPARTNPEFGRIAPPLTNPPAPFAHLRFRPKRPVDRPSRSLPRSASTNPHWNPRTAITRNPPRQVEARSPAARPYGLGQASTPIGGWIPVPGSC
jgi:hypothetical protein